MGQLSRRSSRDGRLDGRLDGRRDGRRDDRLDGVRLRQTITIGVTIVRLPFLRYDGRYDSFQVPFEYPLHPLLLFSSKIIENLTGCKMQLLIETLGGRPADFN